MQNPKSERRPTASDVIILTVKSVDDPDTVLGGARLPVSRVSFPVRFRMNGKNAVVSTQAWNKALASSDLLVQAVVCGRDNDKIDYQTLPIRGSLTAQGVAKLVKLQRPDAQDATIRAAVSLPLA